MSSLAQEIGLLGKMFLMKCSNAFCIYIFFFIIYIYIYIYFFESLVMVPSAVTLWLFSSYLTLKYITIINVSVFKIIHEREHLMNKPYHVKAKVF